MSMQCMMPMRRMSSMPSCIRGGGGAENGERKCKGPAHLIKECLWGHFDPRFPRYFPNFFATS
jgi:hypothetical protein